MIIDPSTSATLRRLDLRWVVLIGIGLIPWAPRPSAADPIELGSDARQRSGVVGPLGDRTLRFRERSEPDCFERCAVELAVGLADKTAEPATWQILYRERGDVSKFEMAFDGQVLEARYVSDARYAPEGLTTTLRWRWVPARQRFEALDPRVDNPHARRQEAMKQAMARGDLASAQSLAWLIGDSPDGGHTLIGDETMGKLWHATHRVAKAHFEQGRSLAAAALIGALARNPPVVSPHPQERTATYCIPVTGPTCTHADGHWTGEINQLPKTPLNTQIVNDCAWFMLESGDLKLIDLALGLLEQVVAHAPLRMAAHLNLADGLYQRDQEGDRARAVAAYRRYLEGRQREGRAVPAAVRQRIEQRLAERAKSPDPD